MNTNLLSLSIISLFFMACGSSGMNDDENVTCRDFETVIHSTDEFGETAQECVAIQISDAMDLYTKTESEAKEVGCVMETSITPKLMCTKKTYSNAKGQIDTIKRLNTEILQLKNKIKLAVQEKPEILKSDTAIDFVEKLKLYVNAYDKAAVLLNVNFNKLHKDKMDLDAEINKTKDLIQEEVGRLKDLQCTYESLYLDCSFDFDRSLGPQEIEEKIKLAKAVLSRVTLHQSTIALIMESNDQIPYAASRFYRESSNRDFYTNRFVAKAEDFREDFWGDEINNLKSSIAEIESDLQLNIRNQSGFHPRTTELHKMKENFIQINKLLNLLRENAEAISEYAVDVIELSVPIEESKTYQVDNYSQAYIFNNSLEHKLAVDYASTWEQISQELSKFHRKSELESLYVKRDQAIKAIETKASVVAALYELPVKYTFYPNGITRTSVDLVPEEFHEFLPLAFITKALERIKISISLADRIYGKDASKLPIHFVLFPQKEFNVFTGVNDGVCYVPVDPWSYVDPSSLELCYN